MLARRYLAQEPEDADVRLLLQAFQLSLGCCAAHAAAHMLREQMLARLMHAAHPEPSSAGAGADAASSSAAASEPAGSSPDPSVTADLVHAATAAAPKQAPPLGAEASKSSGGGGSGGAEESEGLDQLSTLPNAIQIGEAAPPRVGSAGELLPAAAAGSAQRQGSMGQLQRGASQLSEGDSGALVAPPAHTTPLLVARRSLSYRVSQVRFALLPKGANSFASCAVGMGMLSRRRS